MINLYRANAVKFVTEIIDVNLSQWCRPMTRLTEDKPENCGVLLHHFNNKTNFLPTFQADNLLTVTLLLSTILFSRKVPKNKKVKNAFFIKNKNVKTFFYIYALSMYPSIQKLSRKPTDNIFQ